MSIETKTSHITPAGGNVFADLGFEPEEAAGLRAESQRIISKNLAIKDFLIAQLAGWIETKKLKPAEAAEILGVTRLRISDLINKKANSFTIDALVDMLLRIGKRVQFSVH